MAVKRYWWSRYSTFSPGIGIYPHMGEVIAFYRLKRGFKNQEAFAIAMGVSSRTVQDWEASANMDTPDSIERRMFIAKLLRIPPALLALDWHFAVYQNNQAEQESNFTERNRLLEEDTFALYEDILVMGWSGLYSGGSSQIVGRVDDRLKKLTILAQNAPAIDTEQWQSLLCRFYQLTTRFAQRSMNKNRALSDAKNAIDIATQLDDAELIASSLFRRARIRLENSNTVTEKAQKLKYFEQGKADIDAALQYVERIRTPLKGNIFLVAAEVNALSAGSDLSLRKECAKWYDKVATLVYRENIEDDGTFLKLNASALHHEKAKTLIQFRRFQEARSELNVAWRTLQPDLLTWHINMYLTEASLYTAEHDLEGSAKSGIEAYKVAKAVQSRKGEAGVKKLFLALQKLDDSNPYVCNLGMMLGMY